MDKVNQIQSSTSNTEIQKAWNFSYFYGQDLKTGLVVVLLLEPKMVTETFQRAVMIHNA